MHRAKNGIENSKNNGDHLSHGEQRRIQSGSVDKGLKVLPVFWYL